MAGRRALVIGSQCGGLPNLRLTFLPDVAEKLFEVLVDPARGGCDADASVLIIDPELSSLARALESAVAGADAAQATLLVAFIGHAEAVGTDLYLLPANGSSPPSMFTGFLFGQGMAELVRRYSGLDGLIILVDACQSEVGVGDLAQRAASEISAAGMRVQLVSSTFDQAAMDGCFTRSLTRVLSEGVAAHSADYLVAEDVLGGIAALCTAQEEPRAMTIQGRWRVNDPGLFLGWNPAAKAAWFLTGTATGGQAVELTRDFQITDALDQAVRAWRSHQIVFLSGDPGSGKSTLVAALTRPEVAPDIISPGFMAAVVFAETSPDVMAIAEGLAAQLTRMEGFARATEQYRVWVGQDELSQQDPLTRLVVGPLRQMTVTGARRVRLAFDGLDMLDASARDAVFGAVRDLVGDPNLVGVRVLLAGRAGSVPRLSPAQTTVEVMRSPSPEEVRGYLRQRNVAHEAIPGILNNTGSWLDARLYADLAASFQASEGGSAELPGAHVDNSYSQALAAARSRGESAPLFDAVLAVLAAAGSGPVMPLGLLRDALQVAGWDVTESAVRDLLVQLGGLVARAKPGSSDEMVGLVHDTLREYLTTTSTSRGEAAGRGREAILTALDRDSGSPTPRFLEYGRTAKAELLWAVGRNGDALDWVLDSLGPREADNVVILQPWVARCTEVLGPDHLYSLAIRHHLAKHTGSAGELERARGLLTALLEDVTRVLGADHPNTLTTRGDLAHITGEAGDLAGARGLFEALVRDHIRVLGADHPSTLIMRNQLARWIGGAGDLSGARSAVAELLEDQLRLLGPEHPDTLLTRGNLALLTGEAGDLAEARVLFAALLEDEIRVLGADHPSTLITRNNLASLPGVLEDSEGEQELLALLEDQTRVLGPQHPDTLTTQHNLALRRGEAGDVAGAREMLAALLEEMVLVLGHQHPETLKARGNFAQLTGLAGDTLGARELFTALMEEQARVLGADHPTTLTTRHQLARWIGAAGDVSGARELLAAVREDRTRVLGADHPSTLVTRNNFAIFTDEAGDSVGARALLAALVQDQIRVLGSDHPDTLATRSSLASLTRDTGDDAGARRLYEELLDDQIRVLGAGHRKTTTTREILAAWTGEDDESGA